jgi:serine/threonine-protein kinase
MERYLKSRYKIGEKLGENPFSVTYQGSYLTSNNPVIVKIYKRGTLSNTLIKSMREKVKVLERLNHPLIAKLIDGDYGWQGFYYVREYVSGKTLGDYIKEKGRLSFEDALKLGEEICEAVLVCHRFGLIHGALNPSNVFIGEDGRPILADFVIEGEIRQSIQQKTEFLFEGADFASPEELNGAAADERSDLYAIALLVYFMLSGINPFNPEKKLKGLEIARNKLLNTLPPVSTYVPSVSKIVDDILIKALNPDPLLRFNSVQELRDSLHSRNLVLIASSLDLPPVIYENSAPAKKSKPGQKAKKPAKPLFSKDFIVLLLRIMVVTIIAGLGYALIQTIINQ